MAIIVAVDGTVRDDAIVKTGYDLAKAYQETAYILHVVPEEEFDAHLEDILSSQQRADYSFRQEESSASRLALDIAESSLEDFDPELVESIGRVGDPVNEIFRLADEKDAGYIVVGGRKRSPVGKAMFGDKTQQLLLDSERPVVTVMQ